jgi:hypothetical protein
VKNLFNLRDEEVLMEFLKEFRKLDYNQNDLYNCHELYLYGELRNRGLVNTFVEIYGTLYGRSDVTNDLLWILEYKY